MKKLLLVIPENSYKSNDFVTSAEKLDLDFLVITDSQQVSGQFSDTVIIHSFDKELENDVREKLQDVTHVLPVDHSALKFSAYLVDLAALLSHGAWQRYIVQVLVPLTILCDPWLERVIAVGSPRKFAHVAKRRAAQAGGVMIPLVNICSSDV